MGGYHPNQNIYIYIFIYLFVGIGVAVSAEGQQISLILQVPKWLINLNGKCAGLFGNMNGDPSDDLTSSTGVRLNSTASQEEIFHQFGQTCKETISDISQMDCLKIMSPLYVVLKMLRKKFFGKIATKLYLVHRRQFIKLATG